PLSQFRSRSRSAYCHASRFTPPLNPLPSREREMTARPTLIRNAKLIDPSKDKIADGAILFADKILDIGAITSAPDGAEIIDADGAHVAPGLIDMRVTLGDPGAEHKETFKSAGRAAAAGGVTTMVMMPNTTPVIDDQSLVDFVLRRGVDRSGGVHILPAAALTKHLDGEL